MKIHSAIKTASNILMEYWPLHAFIASNPIWSLRHKCFFDAISHAGIQGLMPIDYYYERYQEKLISKQYLNLAISEIEGRFINEEELEQWIEQSVKRKAVLNHKILFSEQFDEYNFQKPITWIKERIFNLLRNYFGLSIYKDKNLLAFWQEQEGKTCSILDKLHGMTAEEGVSFLIHKLNIPERILVDYLESIYLQTYGWSSLMKWRNQHPNNPWIPGQDECESILLLWLSYECMMAEEMNFIYKDKVSNDFNELQKNFLKECYIWQTAFEFQYLNELKTKLNADFIDQRTDVPYDAQFIFCIDTRSEGFRRHLENHGDFQTFGFAGFFGAVFNLEDKENISYQAPALVSATHTATAYREINTILGIIQRFKNVIDYTKKQVISPFALFEMAGVWFLPFMLFKTIQPKLKIKEKKRKISIHNPFSAEEKVQSAVNLLKSIGLTDVFSQYVFICAHQSDNLNNPFKSSLNCGACGGNSGIPNAILMCQILNDEEIRIKLKKHKVHIPENTRFIPACHHTGNDRLSILQGEIPSNLQVAIELAGEKLRQEKANALPGKGLLEEREQNWAELIPELGLINNTSIIIGPRKLTLDKDLERRVFLHSYEPSLDESGDILTNILSAPVIVAHWISSQYYFSTVNPNQFGAGNKAIHNVLPGIGVLEGNLSDLKIGLPIQSTHFQSKVLHEPRRIIVVVYAKKSILDKAINNSPEFKTLLANKWLHLQHIEAKTDAC